MSYQLFRDTRLAFTQIDLHSTRVSDPFFGPPTEETGSGAAEPSWTTIKTNFLDQEWMREVFEKAKSASKTGNTKAISALPLDAN